MVLRACSHRIHRSPVRRLIGGEVGSQVHFAGHPGHVGTGTRIGDAVIERRVDVLGLVELVDATWVPSGEYTGFSMATLTPETVGHSWMPVGALPDHVWNTGAMVVPEDGGWSLMV